MDPLTIASLAGQAGTGLFQIGEGIVQNSKAKKMARNNIRPTYTIPKAVTDNQAITESRASEGLSGTAIDLYKKGSERETTSSIDAILKGGGSVNNIGDLYSNVNNGVSKMALIDDEMRARNMKALTDQNNTLGDYQDKAWTVNVWGPYADKAQAAAALKKQGSDNISKGINSVVGVAANAATANLYDKERNDVYGKKTTGTNGQPLTGYAGQYAPAEPIPYTSNALDNKLSPAQQIIAKYPGLAGGRRGGIAGLDPVYDPSTGGYKDPMTGEPIQ